MLIVSINLFILLIIGVASGQKSLSSLPCRFRDGRIVGGTNTVHGETPYIVSLTRRGGHFCGATIINERWLVTAGHCICNNVNKIMKPSQIRGTMGLHKISDYRKQRGLSESNNYIHEIGFRNIIVHPEYTCSKVANDIALLELQQPIEFNKYVQPICVATKNANSFNYGYQAVVSGWGWTNENQNIGIRADTLQKATVDVWNNNDCQKSFSRFNEKSVITNKQMCAGKVSGGIDSCWADSGGPLVTHENVLIGVVSTGIGCARAGLPGIYTRVSEYTDWMENVIANN